MVRSFRRPYSNDREGRYLTSYIDINEKVNEANEGVIENVGVHEVKASDVKVDNSSIDSSEVLNEVMVDVVENFVEEVSEEELGD